MLNLSIFFIYMVVFHRKYMTERPLTIDGGPQIVLLAIADT